MAPLASEFGRGPGPVGMPGDVQLPRFPRQLFIHCVATLPGFRQVAQHVPGVDKYAERAMLLARREDFVCLAHRVPLAYLEFLNQLGLGPDPAHIIRLPDTTDGQAPVSLLTRLQHSLLSGMQLPAQLAHSQELWLHGFAASEFDAPLQSCLAKHVGCPIRLINQHSGKPGHLYDKHIVRQHARAWGLPLPPGESAILDRSTATASSHTLPVRRAIDKYLGVTGRVIVRGALGASGSSVFVVGSEEREIGQCLRSVAEQRHTNVFLVEPYFAVDVSPNIGMFIDPRDGAIACISVSDQILDGESCHVGNRFPSQAQLVDQMVAAATRSCCWLRDQGTRGYLGFDFCEYRVAGGQQRQFFFAELNPRLNGATYPTHVMARLNAQRTSCLPRWRAFRALNVPTKLRSFAALQTRYRDLLLDGREAAGMIPYNIGLLQHGKLMLAMVGETPDDVEKLHDEFLHRTGDDDAQVRGSRCEEIAA